MRIFPQKQYHSLRDMQYGIQMTAAFVFCALIAFQSDLYNQIPIAWVIPVLATLTIFDTFGGTMFAFILCVKNFLPMTLFVYILQLIGMGYQTYTSVTVLFILVCFWVGYTNPSVATRKIALLIPVILFSTIVITPRELLEDVFVWKLLLEIMISSSVVLAVSLFLFPRFATIEIMDRLDYSLEQSHACFRLSISAMIAQHRSEAQVYLFQAEAILRNMAENQEIMNARYFPSLYEPTGIIYYFLHAKRTMYTSKPLMELIGLSSNLMWHVSSMIHAMNQFSFSKYHACVLGNCKNEFMNVANDLEIVIQYLKTEHDITLLSNAVHKLISSCDNAYKSLAKSLHNAQKITRTNTSINEGDLHSNEKKIGENPIDIDDDDFPYDADAPENSNRLAAAYFLFHFTEMTAMFKLKFHVETGKEIPIPKLFTPISILNSLNVFYKNLKTDVYAKSMTGLRTALILGVALAFVEISKVAAKFENGQWIMLAVCMSQGDNLGGTISTMRLRLLGTLFGAIYSYFIYVAVGTDYYSIIGMFVPFLFICGVIKQNKYWGYFGSISSTTALIVTLGILSYQSVPIGNYSLLRIQENTIGVLLVFVLTLFSSPVLAVDLLKVNISEVLKKFVDANSKIWEHFEKNMAIDAVRTVSKKDLEADIDHVDSYGEEELDAIQQNQQLQVLTYLTAENTTVRAKLGQQPVLIEQASIELFFSSRPFPEYSYTRLLGIQYRILHMMFSLDRALLRISSLAKLKMATIVLEYALDIKPHVSKLLHIVNADLLRWSNLIATSKVLTSPSSFTSAVNDHVRTIDTHMHEMSHIHAASVRLWMNTSVKTEEMYGAWLDSVVDENDDEIDASVVHRRMAVLYSFNALFYVSSQLASAVVDLGNVLFSIYETEYHGKNVPF